MRAGKDNEFIRKARVEGMPGQGQARSEAVAKVVIELSGCNSINQVNTGYPATLLAT